MKKLALVGLVSSTLAGCDSKGPVETVEASSK